MNSQQPAPWPATQRTGSVKRAREGINAGGPREGRRPPHLDLESPRPAPNPRRGNARPGMLPAPLLGPGHNPVAKPMVSPPWPLQGSIPSPIQESPGRSPAPRRPPRPSASRIPSMLDSQTQNPTPSFRVVPTASPVSPMEDAYRQRDQPRVADSSQQPPRNQPYDRKAGNIGGGSRAPLGSLGMQRGIRSPRSPQLNSPEGSGFTTRTSTNSSVGTIPDFPVPLPSTAQRKANAGPPTSRRRPSLHYSHVANVSPIPESAESPRENQSHESYASSAAIPENWGYESPGFRSDEYAEDGTDCEADLRGGDGDGVALIRSASMGKRAKPFMIDTKSSDKIVVSQSAKLEHANPTTAAPVGAAGFAAAKRGAEPRRPNSRSAMFNTTRMYSDSSSEKSLIDAPSSVEEAVSLEPHTEKNTKAALLGAFASASSLLPRPAPARTPSPRHEKMSTRRPPRLDIEAVKEAEARGSMTSLPDLIRRATRLAYMIERGKRPGSAMDLNDFPFSAPKKSNQVGEKHNSGLSGMLASFPAVATPVSRMDSSTWPDYHNYLNDRKPDKVAKNSARRCCGLSPLLFGVVILVVLLAITAAVVVPVKLLILDKPKSKGLTALEKCRADPATTCQNGGSTALMADSQCSCICTNGFTGSTCTVAGMTGCTTFNPGGSDGLNNVTLGNFIPSLLAMAQTNFSIPLSTTAVLGRFNAANLSCSTENALVTFERPRSNATSTLTRLRPRQDTPPASDTEPVAGTTSVTEAPLVTPAEGPTTTAAIEATSSSLSSSNLPTASATAVTSPSDSFVVTDQALDFARVAVLYILQEKDITSATNAQSQLQKFILGDDRSLTAAQNVTLGGGNLVDFVSRSVDVGKGFVGGAVSNLGSAGILSRGFAAFGSGL